jgi:hypothetical protein
MSGAPPGYFEWLAVVVGTGEAIVADPVVGVGVADAVLSESRPFVHAGAAIDRTTTIAAAAA